MPLNNEQLSIKYPARSENAIAPLGCARMSNDTLFHRTTVVSTAVKVLKMLTKLVQYHQKLQE